MKHKRNRNAKSILRYLRTLHIVWSLWDTELLGVSPGSKLCTAFLNIAKNDEIKTKSQFTETATEPHRNRFRKFNNDQYCVRLFFNTIMMHHAHCFEKWVHNNNCHDTDKSNTPNPIYQINSIMLRRFEWRIWIWRLNIGCMEK